MTVDHVVRRWLRSCPGLVWAPDCTALAALVVVKLGGEFEPKEVTDALKRSGYDPRQQNDGWAYALPEKPPPISRNSLVP